MNAITFTVPKTKMESSHSRIPVENTFGNFLTLVPPECAIDLIKI